MSFLWVYNNFDEIVLTGKGGWKKRLRGTVHKPKYIKTFLIQNIASKHAVSIHLNTKACLQMQKDIQRFT